MKISFAAGPVNRTTALNCLLVNQFATPGLGSLLGRRFLAGSVQLLLALAGFTGVIGWFVQIGSNAYRQMSDLPPQAGPYPWLGKAGLFLFLASWLLSWITSISLLREARNNEKNTPPVIASIPPKIT